MFNVGQQFERPSTKDPKNISTVAMVRNIRAKIMCINKAKQCTTKLSE